MDAEEYRKKLETEILEVLEEKLRKGQMDAQRAKLIAQLILSQLHPPLSLMQIRQIAPTLDDEFKELSSAVLFVLEDNDNETRRVVTEHTEKLIKDGKFEEAKVIMENVIND